MRSQPLLFSLALTLLGAAVLGFHSPRPSSLPGSDGVLSDLTSDPVDPASLLAASPKGVYRQGDDKRWKKLLAIPEDASSIRRLIPHPNDPKKIFLITDKGVIEGDLKTGRSRWIFLEDGGLNNRVHTLAVEPNGQGRIYVGTDQGLFTTEDGGRRWLRPYRWPENQPILAAAFLPTEPAVLLLATPRELFFSKDGGETFESGFSISLSQEEEETEDEEDNSFGSFAFSRHRPAHLWIGTPEGVFESEDGGIVWQKLPDRGLEDRRIFDLLFSDQSGLLGATRREVARFDPVERRWKKLNVRFAEPPVAIATTSGPGKGREALWVASGREIYESLLPPLEPSSSGPLLLPSPERVEDFKRLLNREPGVREIQKAAIRYANLGNGKIQRWHWGSRMRAFIPKLSFGKRFSIGNSVDIDRGGTNNPDQFILGPEDIDEGWDLGLSWELGDLLYSSDQTSIDSRAKSLVELRESILSQVTRLYFERRRVQWEIAFLPAESPQEHFDRLLRLDELTAQIDALTHGFLSNELGGEPDP